MTNLSGFIPRVSERLLKRHGIVVVLAGLILLIAEVEGHVEHSHHLGRNVMRDILAFGVLVLLLGGAILVWLARAWGARAPADLKLDQGCVPEQPFINSADRDELAGALGSVLETIVPSASASLLTHDPAHHGVEVIAECCGRNGVAPIHIEPSKIPELWRACTSAQPCSSRSVIPCPTPATVSAVEHRATYCVQLRHDDVLLGLLHLHLPPRASLTRDQMEMLNGVAPLMTLALEHIESQHSASIEAAAASAERRRIARQLHDHLAQNLGYLRLRLDQLTGDDAVREIAAIRQELRRMRDIADDAYEQVRGTLDVLRSDISIDLATALLALAKSSGSRGNFQVDLTSEGRPRPLPRHVQCQILDLFREALANVAKHAHARKVIIRLAWTDEALMIRLADDGSGFEPNSIQANGHYGLEIMQEHAEELQGHLTLASHPNVGTELTFRLPLASAFSSRSMLKG
ncbi:MAG: hypothetical protein D6791_10160 [Chloroflexi bacterium]|nr:MAG: hypothetical protein D6791_10160 [Chloroflexota bacterium]